MAAKSPPPCPALVCGKEKEEFLATDAHRQKLDEAGFNCPEGLTVGGRQVVFLMSSSCRWQKKRIISSFLMKRNI
jgi:hypothetical protein